MGEAHARELQVTTMIPTRIMYQDNNNRIKIKEEMEFGWELIT
jgi:hypothetical protein